MSTKVRARVLTTLILDGLTATANQVLSMDDKLAKTYSDAGAVDTNKQAVAYALEENGGKVIDYIPRKEQRAVLEDEITALEKSAESASDDQKVAIGAQIAEKQAALAALQ